jgi:hypothetical protein
MTKAEMNEVYDLMSEKRTIEYNIGKVVEELAEEIVEVKHMYDGKSDVIDVIKEIVDVEICNEFLMREMYKNKNPHKIDLYQFMQEYKSLKLTKVREKLKQS